MLLQTELTASIQYRRTSNTACDLIPGQRCRLVYAIAALTNNPDCVGRHRLAQVNSKRSILPANLNLQSQNFSIIVICSPPDSDHDSECQGPAPFHRLDSARVTDWIRTCNHTDRTPRSRPANFSNKSTIYTSQPNTFNCKKSRMHHGYPDEYYHAKWSIL